MVLNMCRVHIHTCTFLNFQCCVVNSRSEVVFVLFIMHLTTKHTLDDICVGVIYLRQQSCTQVKFAEGSFNCDCEET